MSDRKFKIQPNKFNAFRQNIAEQFPDWLPQRKVQTITNGVEVVLHPLGGHEFTPDDLQAIMEIEQRYRDDSDERSGKGIIVRSKRGYTHVESSRQCGRRMAKRNQAA